MAASGRPEGYSRRHRFGARGAFGPVLRGSRKVRGRLAVVHVVPANSSLSRLGVTVTRRLAPSSVARNRAKRVAREAFRRHPVKHAGLDCVIALREPFDGSRAPELATELRSLFDRLLAPRQA